jgi:hypothetical protein
MMHNRHPASSRLGDFGRGARRRPDRIDAACITNTRHSHKAPFGSTVVSWLPRPACACDSAQPLCRALVMQAASWWALARISRPGPLLAVYSARNAPAGTRSFAGLPATYALYPGNIPGKARIHKVNLRN